VFPFSVPLKCTAISEYSAKVCEKLSTWAPAVEFVVELVDVQVEVVTEVEVDTEVETVDVVLEELGEVTEVA